jgi:hypothetical protein
MHLAGLAAHEFGHACTRQIDIERTNAPDEEWASEAAADWYAAKWGFGKERGSYRRWDVFGHHGAKPRGKIKDEHGQWWKMSRQFRYKRIGRRRQTADEIQKGDIDHVFVKDFTFEDLYAVLVSVARSHGQITYGELPLRYIDHTQGTQQPRGHWDAVLAMLNRKLHSAHLPPLSAVVVSMDSKEPGRDFWESTPNVPCRPDDKVARKAAYGALLRQVHAAHWPDTAPWRKKKA